MPNAKMETECNETLNFKLRLERWNHTPVNDCGIYSNEAKSIRKLVVFLSFSDRSSPATTDEASRAKLLALFLLCLSLLLVSVFRRLPVATVSFKQKYHDNTIVSPRTHAILTSVSPCNFINTRGEKSLHLVRQDHHASFHLLQLSSKISALSTTTNDPAFSLFSQHVFGFGFRCQVPTHFIDFLFVQRTTPE